MTVSFYGLDRARRGENARGRGLRTAAAAAAAAAAAGAAPPPPPPAAVVVGAGMYACTSRFFMFVFLGQTGSHFVLLHLLNPDTLVGMPVLWLLGSFRHVLVLPLAPAGQAFRPF